MSLSMLPLLHCNTLQLHWLFRNQHTPVRGCVGPITWSPPGSMICCPLFLQFHMSQGLIWLELLVDRSALNTLLPHCYSTHSSKTVSYQRSKERVAKTKVTILKLGSDLWSIDLGGLLWHLFNKQHWKRTSIARKDSLMWQAGKQHEKKPLITSRTLDCLKCSL